MTDQSPAPAAKPIATPTGIERALGRAARYVFAPRMAMWLYLSLALLALVWWLASHMVPVILYKVVIITIMAFVGDKIARASETTNRRPHEFLARSEEIWTYLASKQDHEVTDAQRRDAQDHAHFLEARADGVYLRRAMIIGACVIAGALGS